MWSRLFYETWKKIALGGFFLIACISISLTIYINYSHTEDLKVETQIKIKKIEKNIAQNEADFELIYQYVSRNVPYIVTAMDQDEITYAIRSIISEVRQKNAAAADNEFEQLYYLMWQMQSALQNQSTDDFIGLFDSKAYQAFMYDMDNLEEVDSSLKDIMNELTMNGTFESLTFKRVNGAKSQVEIKLYYNTGKKRKWLLETTKMEHNHVEVEDSEGEHIEMFSTKFDKLMAEFK